MVRSITTESLGRQDVGDGLVVGLESPEPHTAFCTSSCHGEPAALKGFVEGRGLRGLAVAVDNHGVDGLDAWVSVFVSGLQGLDVGGGVAWSAKTSF